MNIIYSGPPINVTIEASEDAIWEGNLDTWEGEQYDTIEACISIVRLDDVTRFETVRTHKAWMRGEPNAGRMTLDIPNNFLANIYGMPGKPVHQ